MTFDYTLFVNKFFLNRWLLATGGFIICYLFTGSLFTGGVWITGRSIVSNALSDQKSYVQITYEQIILYVETSGVMKPPTNNSPINK
jgi:hypothetical protein